MEFRILICCSLMTGFVAGGSIGDLDPHVDQSLTNAYKKHFVAGSSMYNLDTKSVELSGGPNEDHILTVPCESKANKLYNTISGKRRDHLCKWNGEYAEPGSNQTMKAIVPDGDCLVGYLCRRGRQKAYTGGWEFAAEYDCARGCGGHCHVFYHATINVVQPIPPKYVFQNTTIGKKIYLWYESHEVLMRDEKDFDGLTININCRDVGGKLKQDCIWLGTALVNGQKTLRNIHDSNCAVRDLCQGGNFTSPGTFAVSYTGHYPPSNMDITDIVTYTNVMNSPPPCPPYDFFCCMLRRNKNLPC